MIGGHGIKEIGGLHLPKKSDKPLLIVIPLNNESCDVELILTNLCPNNFGYCSSPKTQFTVSIEQYVKKLKQDAEGKKIMKVILYDNNPLHNLNIGLVGSFFYEIKKVYGSIPETVLYCDPSLLVTHYRRIYRFLKRFNGRNNNLFLGRERSNAVTTAKIKRRANSKLRNQKELDKEIEQILILAGNLKESPEDDKDLNFSVILNYILTPFKTYESIGSLLQEVKKLMGYRRVIIKSTFLWPLPGTELYDDYKGAFADVGDMNLELKFFNYENLNYWGQDFENSLFLDLGNALNCRLYFYFPDVYNSWYNLSMIKLARDISLNRYKEEETFKLIADQIPLANLRKKMITFSKIISSENLHKPSVRNLGRLMKLSNFLFFNIPEDIAEQMSSELISSVKSREKALLACK